MHGEDAIKAILSPWPVERPVDWADRVNAPLSAKEGIRRARGQTEFQVNLKLGLTQPLADPAARRPSRSPTQPLADPAARRPSRSPGSSHVCHFDLSLNSLLGYGENSRCSTPKQRKSASFFPLARALR